MSTVALGLDTSTVQPPERLQPPPEPRRQWSRRWVAAIAGAVWVSSGVYLVAPDQQAVETMFGKVVAPRVMPGLHYALPWPVQAVTKFKVRQLQRVIVGGDLPDSLLGRTSPLKAQFLTGDQNIINLRVVVQYSVSVPADYLFQALNPAELVASAVESRMARAVSQSGVDAVLTTEKVRIQNSVRSEAQMLLDGYRAGVQISTVNIETAAPPPDAADAFRDVASARADTSRIISNAQGYANDLVPKARGEARQLLEEAEAYKQRKINEATGDATRFSEIVATYAKAPEVTRRRLYVEAMEQILPRIKKMLVDPNGNVDLTIVRKSEGAGSKGNP